MVSDNDDVLKNADACATVGGVLWYPETVEEIKWVAHNFPLGSGELYHLGYKNYTQNTGIYAINGQFIAGIPFYSRKYLYEKARDSFPNVMIYHKIFQETWKNKKNNPFL